MSRESIHARCLAFKDGDGVVLVCGKSSGHSSPQCYDSGADVFFFPEYKANSNTRKKGK